MNNGMKKIALMISCMMIMGLLVGCSQKMDASSYLKAYLDNAYKKNEDTIVKADALTKDEAIQIRNRILDAELDKLARAVGITMQHASGLREYMEDAMFRAKYSIGEAVLQADGSYLVTVTYEQANVYGPIMDGYQGQLNTLNTTWSAIGQASSEQMAYDKVAVLQSVMGIAVTSTSYDAPQTVNVRVEADGDSFKVNEEDLNKLGHLLFDHDDAAVR